MALVQAAVSREEVAWSSFAALQSLTFIAREDLQRELIAVAKHALDSPNSTEDAPPTVTEKLVAEFLNMQVRGIPERFNEFVALYNHLIDWTHTQADSVERKSSAASKSPRRNEDSKGDTMPELRQHSFTINRNGSPTGAGKMRSRAASYQVWAPPRARVICRETFR